MDKYPWLDWLRFLAAFEVMIYHIREYFYVDYHALTTHGLFTKLAVVGTRLGGQAVITFFVLSGFLVGGIAYRRYKEGRFDSRQYLIDRSTRLMIPLVPALIFTYILLGGDLIQYIGNTFFLQDVLVERIPQNPVVWSLAYEAWFYIGIAALAMGWWPLVVICMLVFTKLEPYYLFCWLLGVLAFTYPAKKSCTEAICASILILYGTFAAWLKADYFLIPSTEVSNIILAAGVALLIRQLVNLRPIGVWGSIEKIGTRLASFSYTLYLTHLPIVIYLLKDKPLSTEYNLTTTISFAGIAILCIIISFGFYLIFERNTNKIRKLLVDMIKK